MEHFHFNFRRHQIYSNFCQQCTDNVNWLHFYWLVMESNTTCCQEWPGLCRSSLGSEHFCSLRWQAERVQSQACVCHVTFSSSVNVVDYFLRDQNWLPRIRPPSIFNHTSRTQGRLCEAEAHGKESGAASWAGEEAVRQLVTQSPLLRWLCRFVTETFGKK